MGDTILVTGGAGYIGAHTCLRLAEAGFTPVAYDNLSNGWEAFARWGPLEVGDVRDAVRLDVVLRQYRPAAIVHFAALSDVGLSTRDPGAFYDNNVGGSTTLFQAARRAGIDKLVFSSTCATYGAPVSLPMAEDHPQHPLSPYGRSKLMVERMLADLDGVGFRSVVLRYFNAAGADPEGRIGEKHEPETHAIPLAIAAARGERERFVLFGDDYDTRDGSCVRDYVHVLDLADAHVLAVRRLLDGQPGGVFNLGTGTGASVLEVVGAIERRSNRPFPLKRAARREGDAASLVADNTKARDLLGWTPRYGLDEIIDHAWAWHANGAQALKR